MRVTYIHHSSFLAELEHVALLFDYFEGELPEIEGEKPLVVFASHRHGDHFSPVIFGLGEGKREVRYVLSDDIWNRQVPEEKRGLTTFIGPGEDKTLELKTLDGKEQILIHAYKSTDEGVAFLIRAEGKTIYHAGDLNDWVWEGEPEEDNRRMSRRYLEELDRMAGIRIDLAFLPLDPRQETNFSLGMDEFMKRVGAEAVFPMHFWGDFDVTERLKKLPCAGEYRERIREIRQKGQVFEL